MSILVLNESEQIFSLDKSTIQFLINPNNNQNNIIIPQNSESYLNIKNLLLNPIALRIRTKQKQCYKINPSCLIINPNSSSLIHFIFNLRTEFSELDVSQHKFLIEGFEIENYNNELKPEKLFEEVVNNHIKVRGTSIKIKSEFIEDYNINLELRNSNIEINEKEEFKNLKKQYESLEEEYNNLKNIIDKEKKIGSNNLYFNLPEIQEKKISPYLTYFLAFIALLFGYYLTK